METIPGHMERLPEGSSRYEAEMLSQNLRDRILVATAEIVAKRGYRGTTIEHIVKRAGISRATFYEHFENREACLLAGFDAAIAGAKRRINHAAAAEADWPSQIRAGIAAFLDYVDANPALAKTYIVESVTAGPAAMRRYDIALREFAPYFARGREFSPATHELPKTLEDSIVGGIVWMIHQRLLRGDVEEIAALLPAMLDYAFVPYLGDERAAELASES